MSTNVPASRDVRTYNSRPLKPNGWMDKRDLFERHAAAMLPHLEVIHER